MFVKLGIKFPLFEVLAVIYSYELTGDDYFKQTINWSEVRKTIKGPKFPSFYVLEISEIVF